MSDKMKQTMRKIMCLPIVALLLVAVASCDGRQEPSAGLCRIHGVAPNPNLDGKQIFLVPLTNDTRWNVDSVVIRDGRFAFERDTLMMAKIIIDYHFRQGFQPLLVVVEPGDIHVEIDSISSAHGTPQNDSLQMWKQITEAHNARQFALRKDGRVAEADSLHLAYKRYTRQLATHLREGVLHDFLENLYPLTYQKQMPDGRIVTVNADTHEEMQ